ncbi:MAG: family acetyltransferase [Friedmanniella sp.]|nr:family acetyltransferase [Friedmanniella sp.]
MTTPATELRVRTSVEADLPELTAIYNHYVRHSHATFDLEPFTVAERADWWSHYHPTGPHRMLVAERAGAVVGYVTSSPFRAKPAYGASVETTVYLDPEQTGTGVGSLLYGTLLDRLVAEEDLHRAYAGVALPNDASARLHRRLGFTPIGTFTEAGFKQGRWIDVEWWQRAL